jgi:hypothetical protein
MSKLRGTGFIGEDTESSLSTTQIEGDTEMKINRKSLGNMLMHALRYIGIMMGASLLASVAIFDHVSKKGQPGDLELYSFIIGAIAAALIYGTALMTTNIFGAQKHGRTNKTVRLMIFRGNSIHKEEHQVSYSAAITLAIAELEKAGRNSGHLLRFPQQNETSFGFTLYRGFERIVLMRFVCEPKTLANIATVINGRLARPDMKAMLPSEEATPA